MNRLQGETGPPGAVDGVVDADYLRALVNRRLGLLVPSEQIPPQRLHRAVRYALLAPGKRVRSLLCVLAAHAAGRDDLAPIDAGCAVEMVHTASLILDDLPAMDDALLRRGQPATHRQFGESTAILGAITLLNRAFGVLAGISSIPASQRTELVATLSAAVGSAGLTAGQEHDLHDRAGLTQACDVDRLNHLKTGVLFVAAVRLGGLTAGVPAADLERLARFGELFGLAFQTADDVADATGTTDSLGKDVGQDGGKPSVISIDGANAARDRIRAHLAEAERALAGCSFDTAPLVRFLADFTPRWAA